MKILFLDIDGVLNSVKWFERRPRKTFGGSFSGNGMDPEAVARLDALIDRTACKVVISSTWRTCMPMVELLAHFRGAEMRNVGAIVSSTPDLSAWLGSGIGITRQRGDEICLWVAEHPDVAAIAVVDDDSDMRGVRERFVQTNFEEGMQDSHCEALAVLLNEQCAPVDTRPAGQSR